MPDYLLCIDNGGTNTKAVIFNKKGALIAASSFPTPRIEPAPEQREVDCMQVWSSICRAIQAALAEAGLTGADIACAACVGHGKGLYLFGADGKPVRNGILSTDNRAWKTVEDWNADGTAERAREWSKQSVLSMQAPPLLRWLKDNEPESYAATRYIFEAKDFVRFMLTGEAYNEITDYSGTNLMNLDTVAFDERLFNIFGIPEMQNATAALRACTDACGAITAAAAAQTGLAEGTPVAGGMFDIDACAVAMNVLTEERLCVIAGTWSINEYISKTPVTDGSVLMNSMFCQAPYFLVEECSPTSAGNLDIFINLFAADLAAEAKAAGASVFALANTLVEEADPASHGIVFLPFLYGNNIGLQAKASLVGILSHHTRGQILQAVYEGVVFSHRYHIEKLLSSKQTPTSAIRLAGGAVRSAVWVRMFADALQLPVEIVESDELGALGGAMAAAVAAGLYADLPTASAAMTTIKETVMPNKKRRDLYDQKYARYKKTAEALLAVWEM